MYKSNEYSTTSDSDSEYLVDTRYYRTTVKCKRKSLKKTIKLIHGRCVVIYRGSGDLLPIAAKDADQNSYSDFVFVCHEPNLINQVKEESPRHDSIKSDDDNDEDENNNAFQKTFINLNSNQQLPKQNSFSFKTKINDKNNNNENTNIFTTIGKESLAMNYNYINNEKTIINS